MRTLVAVIGISLVAGFCELVFLGSGAAAAPPRTIPMSPERASNVPTTSLRMWGDATGTYSTEAEFVKVVRETVSLRKTSGTIIEVPFALLSLRDQELVKKLDIQEVVAEGAGLTPREALDDAFRRAVQSVMTTLVDSHTLEKNDKLISDRVLTRSEGFVVGYKELGPPEYKGGLIRQKIRATVRRRDLLNKVSTVTSESDATGLYAEAVTKLERLRGGMFMIQKELEDYPINVLTQNKSFRKVSENLDDGMVKVEYEVEIRVDEQKFERLQRRLVDIVDPLATLNANFDGESETLQDVRNSHRQFRRAFLSAWDEGKRAALLTVPPTVYPVVSLPEIENLERVRMEGITSEDVAKYKLNGSLTRWVVNVDPGYPSGTVRWRCFDVIGMPKMPKGGLTLVIAFRDKYEKAVHKVVTIPMGAAMPGISVHSHQWSNCNFQTVVLSPFFADHEQQGLNLSRLWFARALKVKGQFTFTLEQLRQIKTFKVNMLKRVE